MLCLLGPAGTNAGSQVIPLKLRPKALALLVRVALEGRAARADLADLIFPDADDPRAALRWHLTYLRKRLPETVRRQLVVSSEHVALTGPLDVDVFERGAEHILESPDDPTAAQLLALYRGDLCAGLTAGHPATVLDPLAQLISVDPYCEDGHALLIDAYEVLGRRDAAAAAYQRYQRMLRQELQTEPPVSLSQRYEPNTPSSRTPPRDAFVSLNQLTLHTVDWPGGEPAILAIHGSTMSAYTFTALAERLAPEVRFVAVDLRGHGFSDKPSSGYSVDQHVQDLCELVATLGLHRPVLLGFSIGGAIAAFAAARSDCCGLVLLEGVIGERAFTENAAATVVKPFSTSLELRFGGFEEYLTRWRAQQVPLSDEAERILERTIRYELAPLPDGTYRRRALRAAFEDTWSSLLQSDALAALAKVRCPILIVQATRPWIEGRPYLTNSIIAAQQKVAPKAQLFVARRSKHPMLVRDPEPEMVDKLKTFVLSLKPT